MRILLFSLFSISIILASCSSSPSSTQPEKPIITSDYELTIATNQKALLILFPCFPCDAQNTNTEFGIVDQAIKNNISVLSMNFNLHLFMTEKEKTELANILKNACIDNHINANNVTIGGFSGGGNVALLMSNYLLKTKHHIQPKGVFIVDAPIDLIQLHEVAQSNIEEGFSDVSVEEAHWIINMLDEEFGNPSSNMEKYEEYSLYIMKTHSLQNTEYLTAIKTRFYTEPDTTWWWENRMVKPNQMNAYAIQNLYSDLQHKGAKRIELITTKNKGYRKNGDRHPHSWSIVDKDDLVKWILSK